MELRILSLAEIETLEISGLIMEVGQLAGTIPKDATLEGVEEHFISCFGGTNDVVILAESEQGIDGFALLHFEQDKLVEMNPWFLGGTPVVSQRAPSEELADRLVAKSVEYVDRQGLDRLEVMFPRDESANSRSQLFERNGMKQYEELVHLRNKLSDLLMSQTVIPDGIHERRLIDVDVELLYECWYQAFLSGRDRSFLERPMEMQREYFDQTFERNDSFESSASLALSMDERVIGFALVRRTHGDNNGHLWEFGIHPEFRRRGLARFLMSAVRDRLEDQGFKTMSMNVDISNEPAYRFYKILGFEEAWGRVCHAWNRGE
ncbi:MAG: GNAT family N-acetyltransferase [Candidatus Thorarchaeota archaeon]|nr:MAG: GNAT family N-acetyltransferase [Candidatus Thorarchaeota archaeon]